MFDQNDSGNISFGTCDGANRYFIKIAGARTSESCTTPQQAVATLKTATGLYAALKAVTPARAGRYASIQSFWQAWRAATAQ